MSLPEKGSKKLKSNEVDPESTAKNKPDQKLVDSDRVNVEIDRTSPGVDAPLKDYEKLRKQNHPDFCPEKDSPQQKG